ncbi:MAG TPA: VCBS repeat-containing protein [Pyrinomonadaceae bacterium]|jgi:hypothetical protein
MSKKRRVTEKKNTALNLSSATSTAFDENQAPVAYPEAGNKSVKPGLLAYLKNNWWAVALIAFLSLGALASGLKYLEEDAKRQIEANKDKPSNNRNQSFLSSINPFLSNPTPTPLQLSKEYIYAGSRLLAVEDANASAAPPADLAVWRPSSGYWYVMGVTQQQWGSGSNNDVPVPGDYDGDGKTDFAVYRPASGAGIWCVIKSSTGTDEYYNFGTSGDIPRAADFDGDGKSDAALFRPSNGTWYVHQSTTGNLVTQQFGISTDKPVPADYDGDGKADIAVFRDGTTPYFYSLRSSDGQFQAAQFGATGDAPQPADYDGDGRADYAVWRPSSGNWHINQSSNNAVVSYQWGVFNQDTAVPNDYDGDGKVDVAVWRGSSSNPNEIGSWYIRNSSSGQMRVDNWGLAGDTPVPAFYRR